MKGYRRNAEYGVGTRRRNEGLENTHASIGCMGEVNPPGKRGWAQSGTSRTEKNYGNGMGMAEGRKKRVSEVRTIEGYMTNGLGRKGDAGHGYVVYGEYRRVRPPVGKKVGSLRVRAIDVVKSSNKANKEVKSALPWGELVWSAAQGSMAIDVVNSPSESAQEDVEAKRERRLRMYEAKVGVKVRRERKDRSVVVVEKGRVKELDVYMRGRKEGSSLRMGLTRSVRSSSPSKGYIEALAVVVVRSGVCMLEQRRVNRRVRSRENAGRAQIRVLSEWSGRRKRRDEKGRLYSGEWKSGAEGYYGYKVRVKGRVDGARRSKEWSTSAGTVPWSRKDGVRGSAEGVAKTSVGAMGVSVTYCYGLGK